MMMAMLGVFNSVALILGTANAASLGAVYTEGGMVQGEKYSVGLFRYMDVFKGIPFAAPPGRLEKPVPHPGCDGVLKATDYSKRCMQLNLLTTDVVGSEDCLYLNIWVPQGRSVSTNLPVMVFIYGGGFLLGGGQGANFLNNYLYDGQEIADRGNVIVVTFNYRVGSLGFLSSGDADAPGNYGLWDQHAAISWVHRNIRAFGGNPDNITIFGESAGGASVNFQILSPKNKGLIRRAISQSGVALCPWAVNRNPRQYAEEIARKVGCPTDSGMVACLRRTDPKTVTLAGNVNFSASASHPIVHNLALSPVIDGDFLPGEPETLFGNAADIDYIAGVNDMDGHIFATIDIPSLNNALVSTPVEDVRALSIALSESRGPDAGITTYEEYTVNWGSKPSDKVVKKTIVDMETDYIFLVPTQAALYLHSDHAKSGRTYSYLFSEPSRMPIFPLWMGADHADDLQFVFGKPFSTPLGYFPRHRDVAKYMISYWTNFAQTGDPSKGESSVPVSWPEFASSGHQYLNINNKMNRDSVKQMLRTRLVYYWTTVFASFPAVQKS
ncbi:bile salt-activated lipase-like [Sinocyclocheilus anshuiensis]|nr:PREDICTED: bile salt-activated lipase-like [Sinocyclocheilus anshuiensis]